MFNGEGEHEEADRTLSQIQKDYGDILPHVYNHLILRLEDQETGRDLEYCKC